jgi:hypothetical protein
MIDAWYFGLLKISSVLGFCCMLKTITSLQGKFVFLKDRTMFSNIVPRAHVPI